MHCLWEAYRDHITYLNKSTDWYGAEDWTAYQGLKYIGQRNIDRSTWGGITPWLIYWLALSRDLQITVQHDIWTPEHYLADATPVQTKIINFSDFGERGITLTPAIYCDLDTQHAMFAEEIPDGNIVLAIQLSRKGG